MPRAIQCQSDIGIEKQQRHCKRPVPAWHLNGHWQLGHPRAELSCAMLRLGFWDIIRTCRNRGTNSGTGNIKESPFQIIKIIQIIRKKRYFQKRMRFQWFTSSRPGSLTPDPKAWLQHVLPVVLPRVAENTMSLPGST